MATILPDISRTFNEFLLLPNLTTEKCIPNNVSLRTPLVKFKRGEEAKYYANVPMVRQWMENAGCERIFLIDNTTREGIDELLAYLEEDLPSLTMEEAKYKQDLGLNEWDPMPEGLELP